MAIKIEEKIPAPKFQHIPDELKLFPNWLLWQARPIDNDPVKLTKVPVTIEGKKFVGWNNPKYLYSLRKSKMPLTLEDLRERALF